MRVSAIVAGAAIYALALPPFDYSSGAWLALVPLLLAIRGQSWRRAFGYGALSGFLSAWAVTWWLPQALASYFAAGLPIAVLAMSAAYAVAVAIPFGLFAMGSAQLLRARLTTVTPFAVAALWTAAELLRGRLIGQPWGILGYTQHAHTAIIQVAALTGVYGVSFLVALGSGAVAIAALQARAAGWRAAVGLFVAPLLVIAGGWLGGSLAVPHVLLGDSGARQVAIVQTNVPPAFEWTLAYAQKQLQAHVEATDRLPTSTHPALIVWPENAIPRYLETDPSVAAAIAEVAIRHRADVLFGAPRYENGRTFNSVRLITSLGRNGGTYDKQNLVLFAEAHPLAPPVPGGPSDSPRRFSAGEGASVLRSFVPLAPSVCHEILYPELVTRAVFAGGALLVNVSNDGWLDGGYGFASRQHFAMALFRAVEGRRYLVRAAITGISGVVDPYGRVLQTLPTGMAGVLNVPVVGVGTMTPYTRFGDTFAIACGLAGALVLWATRPAPVRQRRLVPLQAPI